MRKLSKDDIILMELACGYRGYSAQIGQPICVGPPPAELPQWPLTAAAVGLALAGLLYAAVTMCPTLGGRVARFDAAAASAAPGVRQVLAVEPLHGGTGGVAVIAHPGRYKLTPNEEFALFTEFKNHGGQGVEVMTGAHNQADYLKYAGYCQEFGLVASRGSDFHSPEESHMDLGRLPDLPGSVTPVWELLQSRILQ